MSLAERVYKALLGLYPKDFRERYALEMMQTFRDAHRQARLEHRSFAFWLGTLMDAISSAIREHARGTGGSMSPIVRIGAVCFVIGGLLDMFRSSQLVWGDLSAFGPGSVEGIFSRIIGALGIAGLQAARTSPMNRLEKAGFAIVWLGFLLGSLHEATMALLLRLGFQYLDLTYGLPSMNGTDPIWTRVLAETYRLLGPIQQILFLSTSLGFLVVAFGRIRRLQGRFDWRFIPPESWLLFMMSVWVLLRSLLQHPVTIMDSSVPRTELIPIVSLNLPEILLTIALGVVLWRKSSAPSVPPRAKTA